MKRSPGALDKVEGSQVVKMDDTFSKKPRHVPVPPTSHGTSHTGNKTGNNCVLPSLSKTQTQPPRTNRNEAKGRHFPGGFSQPTLKECDMTYLDKYYHRQGFHLPDIKDQKGLATRGMYRIKPKKHIITLELETGDQPDLKLPSLGGKGQNPSEPLASRHSSSPKPRSRFPTPQPPSPVYALGNVQENTSGLNLSCQGVEQPLHKHPQGHALGHGNAHAHAHANSHAHAHEQGATSGTGPRLPPLGKENKKKRKIVRP